MNRWPSAYPDNDRVVTVAVDGVVRVWKNGGAELESYRLPFGGLADVSPDGKSVLVASAPNEENKSTVALWDIEPWKERWSVEFPVLTNEFTPKYLVDVQFAPGGRAVVRSNVESGVAIVDTTSGEVLSRIPTAMGIATVSPDGRHTEQVNTVAFSPDDSCGMWTQADCSARWN